MLQEHPMQYLTQAAPPAPAPLASVAAPAGQDQISSTLARMSRPELYNILAQMKALIEQNSAQARQILVQNPQLTKALFQAQVALGMVPGAPLLQASPPPPAQLNPLAFSVQQQPPQQYVAQAPAVLAGAYANGSLTAPPNGFSTGVQAAVANYGAPLQAQQQQQPQPATPVYSQQQQQAPSYHLQQQGPPPPQQMQAQPQAQQQQQQQLRPAQQYAAPQPQQQQQPQQQPQQALQQEHQQSVAAAAGQPQGAQPSLGADQQRGTACTSAELSPLGWQQIWHACMPVPTLNSLGRLISCVHTQMAVLSDSQGWDLGFAALISETRLVVRVGWLRDRSTQSALRVMGHDTTACVHDFGGPTYVNISVHLIYDSQSKGSFAYRAAANHVALHLMYHPWLCPLFASSAAPFHGSN